MKIIKKNNILEVKSNSILFGLFFIALGLLSAFFMLNEYSILKALDESIGMVMFYFSPLMLMGAGLSIIETQHFIFDSNAGSITININKIYNNKIEQHKFKDLRCFGVETKPSNSIDEDDTYSVYAEVNNEKILLVTTFTAGYNDKEKIANELNDWLSYNKDDFNQTDI